MATTSLLIALICCCFASAIGRRVTNDLEVKTVAPDMPSAPGDPSSWKHWLKSNGRNLHKRLMWFQQDAYAVVFDMLEGAVTFIVVHDADKNALTFNLFAVDVTNKLLSSDDTPAPSEKVFNDKVWAHSLFESKCLSLGFTSNGEGHLHDVGTQIAAEYGGCGSYSRGKMLMKLADDLACKFGQTSMVLTDASQLHCRQKPQVEESMTLFYTLKAGKSWYESFGYEKMETKDAEAAHKLTEIGAEMFDSNKAISLSGDVVREYADRQAELGKSESTNREFVMWVWDAHCDQWRNAIELLYGKATLARIHAGQMHKVLTCS